MKNLFIAISLILLTSCGGIKTSSSGLEKESFLEFIGSPSNYSGGVDVSVDNKTTFNAEVYNDKASRVKGKVYAISTGQHVISVTYKNRVIFNKQIFLSTQETKKILLP
ncbi:MAG: hypothetical protein P4L34_10845 [Paludibacter sp.]|nr:hypothetical protein [Paludibacter sp.]